MLLKAFHGGTLCFTVAGIWLLLLAGLWGDGAYAGQLLAQYPDPDDPPQRFSHMVIDQKTQRVFVAGTNRLLQVSKQQLRILSLPYSLNLLYTCIIRVFSAIIQIFLYYVPNN